MVRLIERILVGVLAVFGVFVVGAAVTGAVGTYVRSLPPDPLAVGEPAADFAAPVAGSENLVLDTARLRGLTVLVTIWDENCECADSLELANRHQTEFGGKGFVALAVNTDNHLLALRHRAWAERIAPDVIRLEDTDGRVRARLRGDPPPRWVLIGPSGNVADFGTSVGPDRRAVIAAARS